MASSTKSIRESFSEDNLAGMSEAHHELVQECQKAFTTAGGDPGTYHIHAYRPRPRPSLRSMPMLIPHAPHAYARINAPARQKWWGRKFMYCAF